MGSNGKILNILSLSEILPVYLVDGLSVVVTDDKYWIGQAGSGGCRKL